MEDSILERIQQINARIHAACRASHRSPEEVKLILATKTVPPSRIQVALSAGHAYIAENRVQELKEKYEALRNVPHINHFIGHLQSNKVKDLIRYDVQCLHSLDRWSLAKKLQARLQREDKLMEVLVQINTSGEASKFGLQPQEALTFVRRIADLDRLKIKGLMTIGLFSADELSVRRCFQRLRMLRDQIAALQIPGVSMEELSMGMSGDLEWAIAEGATMVRVGTAIFGPRPFPDSYYWNEKGI